MGVHSDFDFATEGAPTNNISTRSRQALAEYALSVDIGELTSASEMFRQRILAEGILLRMQIELNESAAPQAVLLNDAEALARLEGDIASLPKARLTREQLDSLGFALQNSLSQISFTFERLIKDGAGLHRELLEKMFPSVPPLRSAFLPEKARPLLDLLAFRRLFRHSYELTLEERNFTALASRWQKESQLVKAALRSFSQQLAHGAPSFRPS